MPQSAYWLDEIQKAADQRNVKSPEDQKSRIVFQLRRHRQEGRHCGRNPDVQNPRAGGISTGNCHGTTHRSHRSVGWRRFCRREKTGSRIGSVASAGRSVVPLLEVNAGNVTSSPSGFCSMKFQQAACATDAARTAKNSLKPVSRMTSESRGAGYPVPVWNVKPGHANHLAGHDHDYLYFASPLTGTFFR